MATQQDYSPIQLSPWQRKVAGCLQAVDTLNSVLLSGGRGGGKSVLLIWLIIYFCIINGKGHNGALIRTDLAGLQKLEDLLYQHLPKMLPGSKYFKAKRIWRCSNGAQLMLIHQRDDNSWAKLQGQSLSHCYLDELSQFPDPQTVLRLRSSMRTDDPLVQLKFIATCNPFPHGWWVRDYIISKSVPGRIFNCEFFGGVETVWFKSTLRDNPYLANPDQYEADLKASAFGDESRARAEIFGDWSGSAAGFFGGLLQEEKVMVSKDFVMPWLMDSDGVLRETSRANNVWIGGDFGTASPSSIQLMCQLQEDYEWDGKFMRRGSWVCVDEEYVCSIQKDGSKEWNRGDRTLTAPVLVQRVKDLYRRHGFVLKSIPARRVIMDSAVTAQLGYSDYKGPVTLSSEFSKYGWDVTGSPKGSRAVGWQLIRSLLHNACEQNGEPGLYISERCESLWATLPYCVSDEKNPDDMQKEAPDHSADAIRYAIMASNKGQHYYVSKTFPTTDLGLGVMSR